MSRGERYFAPIGMVSSREEKTPDSLNIVLVLSEAVIVIAVEKIAEARMNQ